MTHFKANLKCCYYWRLFKRPHGLGRIRAKPRATGFPGSWDSARGLPPMSPRNEAGNGPKTDIWIYSKTFPKRLFAAFRPRSDRLFQRRAALAR
jgi:hypothetical protein